MGGKRSRTRLGVAVGEVPQTAVDLAPPPAGSDGGRQIGVARRADGEALAVVGQDVEGGHVVGGAAGHDGVDAAAVVADHAAQGAAVVGGRVGPEGEAVGLGGGPQVVQHRARLHHGQAALGVDLDDPMHVLGEVQHHRHVAALAGQAGAAAAGQDRHVVLAAEGDSGHDVVGVAREDDADWDLPVVGGVGGVQGAAAAVEADLAGHVAAEGAGEGGVGVGGGGWA